MARGGHRSGSGRKKGQVSEQTARRKEIAEAAYNSGLTPLEYMLSILRDEANDQSARFAAAKEAAPYIHPRLSAVTADVEAKATVTMTDEATNEVHRRIARLAERSGSGQSSAGH